MRFFRNNVQQIIKLLFINIIKISQQNENVDSDDLNKCENCAYYFLLYTRKIGKQFDNIFCFLFSALALAPAYVTTLRGWNDSETFCTVCVCAIHLRFNKL